MLLRLVFFCFALSIVGCATKQAPPPNYVIFIADDVSIDDLGIYGNQAVHSPNIDSIGKIGLVFNNMFLTTSSCSPSRASILTGRYPHNTGAPELHMPLPAEVKTIGHHLKNAGYLVGSSGKWHLGEAAKSDFTLVLDTETGEGGEARWQELVNEIQEDKPFFLWLAAYDAHRNWGENPFTGSTDTSKITPPPYLIPDSSTINDFVPYYDEITRFDYHIGQTVKSLTERGLMDNTVIIIMADNGRPFPRDKTRLYDSGIKTPFIFWAPEHLLPESGTTDALVSVIDIVPTLSGWSGIEYSEMYQGIDFSHLLNVPSEEHRTYVFAEHNWHDYMAHERMIRSADYLLIENAHPDRPMAGAIDLHHSPTFASLRTAYQEGTLNEIQQAYFMSPRPSFELYDVKSDPEQLNNLALNPEYQEILSEYRSRLNEWRETTGDDTPENPTADMYDFLTAEPNEPGRHFADIDRGGIPGELTGAYKIVSSDSTYLFRK